MYKLFVFPRLLHYILVRAIDTYYVLAVLGIWCHLHLLCPGSEELRNIPGFLTLYSVSFPAEFFAENEDVLIYE